MKKLLLIDGYSVLFRAYHGMPDLTDKNGTHVGAIYGFITMLVRILKNEKPDALIVARDSHGKTFRHEMYSDYKGTRKPMDEELREQLPLFTEILDDMGIEHVEKEGYEGDDILGTLARIGEEKGYAVTIFSGDRDILQLATDTTRILLPKTKAFGKVEEEYFAKDVKEAYGVTPKEFIDVKALWGDTSDNIPGVSGIGEKTSKEIIAKYHSIENAHEHAEEIKPPRASKNLIAEYDTAVLSKRLATIVTDAPITLDEEKAEYKNIFTDKAREFFIEHDFRRLLTYFSKSSSENNVQNNAIAKNSDTDAHKNSDSAHSINGSGAASFGSINVNGGNAAGENSGDRPSAQESDNDNIDKSSVDESDFQTLESLDAFEKVASEYIEGDTQTIGISLISTGKKLYGISISDGKSAYYFPVTEEKGKEKTDQISLFDMESGEESEKDKALSVVTKIFESKKKIASDDLKRDYHFINPEADYENAEDVTVLAYLLNPLPKEYPLDSLSNEYLNLIVPSFEEIFGNIRGIKEPFLDIEKTSRFATLKAYSCAKLSHILYENVKRKGMEKLYKEIERPLIFCLYEMEKEGILCSLSALKEYDDKLSKEIDVLQDRIYKEAGEEFNINSPKQLGEVLFEHMKLPGGKKTKTGYSTSADVLEKMRGENPIVDDILSYRQYTKLKSTYAEGLTKCIEDDGRIHTTFQQTVTATGRLSSTEPNLQNIPIRLPLGREIRKAFYPKEGYIFVDADYSQIELRVLAHLSQDENLINAYKSDADIHRATAALVFHKDPKDVTDLDRRRAKAVNFGIVYGISSFGLGENLGISSKEAKQYIDDYYLAYPKLKLYLDALIKAAKDLGFAETLFHRRRPIPELSSKAFMVRQFGERVAMNSPIQGTAADIMKLSMVKVMKKIREEGLDSKVLLQVHDELLIETKLEEKDKIIEILNSEMAHAVELSVPLQISVESGNTWYEAK